MSSNYPGSLDNFSTSHADGVNETIHASTVNDLADAINKIESTLGANPVLSSNFGEIRKVTASATVASTDYQILVDTSVANADLTITLPAASSVSGQRVLVRKIDSVNHTAKVTPAGTDTIDGLADKVVLRKQYELLEIVSDGSGWQRVSSAFGNQNIYYVDASYGNDLFSGHFPWAAKKTISAAIGSSRIIYVAPGTYVETVDAHTASNCRITGIKGIKSVGSVIQAPSDTASAITLQGGSSAGLGGLEIDNLTLTGSGTATYTGIVLRTGGGNCYFHDLSIDGGVTETVVQGGVYGGIGMECGGDTHVYNRIDISHCNIAWREGNVGEVSECIYDRLELTNNWQAWVQVGQTETGVVSANTYRSVKSYGNNIDPLSGYVYEFGQEGSPAGSVAGNVYQSIDGSEHPDQGTTHSWRINVDNCKFQNCTNTGTTSVSIEGDHNEFDNWTSGGGVVTVASGATGNVFRNPMGPGGIPIGNNFANNGTRTRYLDCQQPTSASLISESGLQTEGGYGFAPASASGRWYQTPIAPQASVVVTQSRVYLLPIILPEWGKQFSDFAVHVVTGAASSVAKAGIWYPDLDNLPGTLWVTIGAGATVDTSTSGDKAWGAGTTSSPPKRGLMWLGVVFQGGAPTVRGAASGGPPSPLIGDSTLATITGGGAQAYFIDGVTSTLPNATPGSLVACGDTPMIFYKYN